ncbi:response regulator transcription factor [Aquiflexum gelatinilyticum]|uniref:response regulator transcription factor n=1 Tax=Aquiflexum gelatinilyticum TaxID=2961943 RepID=UPI00216786E4|nr:response regulator transcription factor [Aquiflexum gelatinilyticum]MCS4434722.1 response regulator transcription factor [Aquiflexum gelatinilyticum]
MSTQIIIADDHELFTSGLDNLVSTNPNIKVLAHFRNGKEVLTYLERGNKADVLILDLNMPVMDGLQLLGHLQRDYPVIKKLVISMHQTTSSIELCKNLGADGFIGKDSSLHVMLNALNVIIEGGKFFQESNQVVFDSEGKGFYEKLNHQYKLSKREVDIIQLILNQYESSEIADKLNLSPLTVKTHRKNIFRKLGVRNLAGLVALVKDHPRL